MSIVLWHNSQSWGLSCLHVDDTKSAQDSSYHIRWLFPLYRNSKCCPYWIQLWLLATLSTVPITWTPFHNLWCFWWSLHCCIKTLMTNESHSKQPKFLCKPFKIPFKNVHVNPTCIVISCSEIWNRNVPKKEKKSCGERSSCLALSKKSYWNF